ncbi:MAG: GNAT family N-acetyltransferase [Chloroflexi bacterium]|nr:GNAT family N-acetyltransferase [Chloroflexota bacterium]
MTENSANPGGPAFLETPRLILRGLEPGDAGPAYLGWLNDPEVLRYRGPKAFPSDLESIRNYIAGIARRGDLVLAILRRETGAHIGNVALNSIQWVHRSAELSIMIGDKSSWRHGFGKETIRAVTRHAFAGMGLLRLWAESPNPAFNAAVTSLGWTREGAKRKAFLLDGQFVDITCWGLLAAEFKPNL